MKTAILLYRGLNPSSSGLPIPGQLESLGLSTNQYVLIPLLVDYPFRD